MFFSFLGNFDMATWKFDTLGVMEEKNSSFRNMIMFKNECA